MRKLVILLVIGLLHFNASAQLTANNLFELRGELLRLVNNERNLKGLATLSFDPHLLEAAQSHSDYMAKNQLLSHEQTSKSTKEPFDRVKKTNGKDFELVGENILTTIPQTFPLKSKSILELAASMFLQWKNSPPHYKNILYTEYVLTDFGFAVDSKTNTIYAAEVFGKKGVVVPNQLSQNAFGITKGNDDCDELIGNKNGIIINLGNAVRIEDNRVMLYYHDAAYIKTLFNDPTDGLAVDLVFDHQVECGSPNSLDFSPVYDGIMLQPIYSDALFESNEAKGNYRLVAPIGIIPAIYDQQAFSISLIIIQNGMECSYTFPVEIPSASYQLSDIEPILKEEVATSLKNTGIVHSEEKHFDFKSNSLKGIMDRSEREQPGTIYSVSITSYSSVDGKQENNERLHNGRAQFMLRQLHQERSFNDSIVHITAMENWPKMRFQLNYFGMDSLANQSTDSIKNYLRLNRSPFWDSLMFTQRHATAILHIEGSCDSSFSFTQQLAMNLRTAIAEKNDHLANKALYEMYYSDSFFNSTLFEPFIFQALSSNPALVQNAAALLSQDIPDFVYPCTEFVDAWIYRLNELSPESKHNLINLYTHLAVELLNEWDVPSQRLSKVINPTKLYTTANELHNESLMLNFHLAAIQYFSQVNDQVHINRSFDYIVSHFKKVNLTEQERIDLALFFNNWTQYHSTIDLLLETTTNPAFSEESAFILLATSFAYHFNMTDDRLEQIQERAYAFNPDRWCSFINENKQLKRFPFVKNAYCNRCE